MKKSDKSILVAAGLAVAAIIFLLVKEQKEKKQLILDSIAEEGYETAHDILYPLKINRDRGSRIRSVFLR